MPPNPPDCIFHRILLHRRRRPHALPARREWRSQLPSSCSTGRRDPLYVSSTFPARCLARALENSTARRPTSGCRRPSPASCPDHFTGVLPMHRRGYRCQIQRLRQRRALPAGHTNPDELRAQSAQALRCLY
jgi:hypothetical protein